MQSEFKRDGRITAVSSLFILVILISSKTVHSYEPFSFQSARSMGMGGCVTAVSDDPLTVFHNPAGLANAEHKKITIGTSYQDYSWQLEPDGSPAVDYNLMHTGTMLSYIQPNIGFASNFWIRGDKNEKKYTTQFGPAVVYKFKDFSYETSLIFGIAKRFYEPFSLGANIKYLRSDAEEEVLSNYRPGGSLFDPEQTLSLDVGVLYNVKPNVEIGASLHNVYTKLDYRVYRDKDCFGIAEELPRNFTMGTSIKLNDKFLIGVDFMNLLQEKIQMKEAKSFAIKPEAHLGTEILVYPNIFIRGGLMMIKAISTTYPSYKYLDRNIFTFGSGYQHSHLAIDFACAFDNRKKDMEENPGIKGLNSTFVYLVSGSWIF